MAACFRLMIHFTRLEFFSRTFSQYFANTIQSISIAIGTRLEHFYSHDFFTCDISRLPFVIRHFYVSFKRGRQCPNDIRTYVHLRKFNLIFITESGQIIILKTFSSIFRIILKMDLIRLKNNLKLATKGSERKLS